MESVNSESDIKSWLTTALAKEELKNLSVDIVGNSGQGDGYSGDIIFVTVTGTDKQESQKVYNLILKCSKPNEALRKFLLQDTYLNEIYMYDKVFPAFEQFQISKGVTQPFSSIPKCYGTFSDNTREVIILENLKKSGYDLWNHRKPLSREHMDLVVSEYGKFHALSAAMQELEPQKYKDLTKGLTDVYSKFLKEFGMIKVYESLVQETYDVLKNDVDKRIMQKWLSFKDQVNFVFSDMIRDISGLEVIVHGDCWSNNFMYQYSNGDADKLSKVAILDWQMSFFTSPILDLSYFIFSCISEDDYKNMDDILKIYYNSFSSYLKVLGSNLASKFTMEQFLEEWRDYSRGGILMALLPLKISYIEKEEIPDIVKIMESGGDITSCFMFNIKDKTSFKNRVLPLVIHAARRGLIL